ncbi:MAG: mycothiol transferase [Mycobacteriales bacterium]
MDWWYFIVERHLERMLAIAEELGDDCVNEVPSLAGANSAYQIVFHCCGLLEWWTREAALGSQVGRDRDAEFTASGTVADLVDRVATVKRQLREDLPSLDVAAGLRGDPSPHYANTPIGRSVGGVLLHVFEEIAQHHGHLDLTRDLLLQ